jgi:uncharacterized protein (DUF2062 family)
MSDTGSTLKSRWLAPFVDLLRQGMSPEKIALTIALGFMLGVTPVLGSTTILCTLAAFAFRLNLPAIQLVNGVVYPLQLILLIPLYKMGAWIFRANASVISMQGVLSILRAGMWSAIQSLWVVTMHALVAWLALGFVTTAVLYVVLVPIVGVFWKRESLPS